MDLSLFKQFCDHMPIGAFIFEVPSDLNPAHLTYRYVNEACSTITNMDWSQTLGSTIEEQFPKLMKTDIPQKYINAYKSGKKRTIGIVNYGDQRVKSTHYEVHAIRLTKKYLGVTFIDYEPILKQQSAEQANNAKTKFLTHLSHELRTPANGIQGMLEMVLATEQLDTKATKKISTALDCSKAFTHLLDDLIDTTAIEENQIRIEHAEFNLFEMLSNILNAEEKSMKHDYLLFNLLYPPEIPHLVMGDPTRTRQIVTNLVHNASKFTEQGYVQIVVDVNEETQQLSIRVKDTGCGMDMSDPTTKDNIFRRYGRLATIGVVQGRGLGLWISYKLANLMNGFLDVESKLGKGSTFILTLPYHKPQQNLEKERERKHSIPIFNFRCLVVEDDIPSQQTIQGILEERYGNFVTIVNNGWMAIEKWKHGIESGKPFDCIFMDCFMPVMDGEQATKEIRMWEKEHSLPRTPIIGCSASVLDGKEKRIEDFDMDDYIIKPINLNSIETVLRHVRTMKQKQVLDGLVLM